MRKKLKRKPKRKVLNSEERKAFAQAVLDGKMARQLASEYGVSLAQGYLIVNDLLEYKLEWKNKMPKYFTYIDGPRGPEPQIWYGSPVDGAGKSKPSAMKPVELADSDLRTIEELKRDYPIEAKP